MSSSKLFKKIRYTLRFIPDSLYIQLNYFGHFKKFANLKKTAKNKIIMRLEKKFCQTFSSIPYQNSSITLTHKKFNDILFSTYIYGGH